jgi:undecaprenyl-diphosphatase
MIIISDKVSTFFKYLMKTLRPSHEIYLKSMIHISKAGPGGLYGYVSSHASNFFALAIFIIVLLPNKYNWFKIGFFISAILVSYSRIYNGVHYPFDVVRGIFLGSAIGLIISLILKFNIINKLKAENF